MSVQGIGVAAPTERVDDGAGEASTLTPPTEPLVERNTAARSHPLLAVIRRCLGALAIVTVALLAAAVLILSVGPRFLPFQSYVVLTGSMSPTLPVGTVVILEPVDVDDLVVGDVMTFNHPQRRGEVVTHRIVSLEENPKGRVIETKGDANPLPDSWRLVGRGQTWRLAFAIPFLGHVFSALQQPLVRQLLLIIPAIWLAVWLLRDIWFPQPRKAIP
jgi:signal peptidase